MLVICASVFGQLWSVNPLAPGVSIAVSLIQSDALGLLAFRSGKKYQRWIESAALLIQKASIAVTDSGLLK